VIYTLIVADKLQANAMFIAFTMILQYKAVKLPKNTGAGFCTKSILFSLIFVLRDIPDSFLLIA